MCPTRYDILQTIAVEATVKNIHRLLEVGGSFDFIRYVGQNMSQGRFFFPAGGGPVDMTPPSFAFFLFMAIRKFSKKRWHFRCHHMVGGGSFSTPPLKVGICAPRAIFSPFSYIYHVGARVVTRPPPQSIWKLCRQYQFSLCRHSIFANQGGRVDMTLSWGYVRP